MEERIDNENRSADRPDQHAERHWKRVADHSFAGNSCCIVCRYLDLCDLSAGIPNFDNICCYGKRYE